MNHNKPDYDIQTIRQLLREAFTQEELRRACLDSAALRPVVDDFGFKYSLNDMVDVIIDYCRRRLLFDDLLEMVERLNPAQFARFKPRLTSSAENAHMMTTSLGEHDFPLLKKLINSGELVDQLASTKELAWWCNECGRLVKRIGVAHDPSFSRPSHCWECNSTELSLKLRS
jgi:hypothetical protein